MSLSPIFKMSDIKGWILLKGYLMKIEMTKLSVKKILVCLLVI